MAKAKKKHTFEVAYWHQSEIRIVPVCAESMLVHTPFTLFFIDEEVCAAFAGVVYVKRLSDDRQQPTMVAPSSFTESQLRLVSDKVTKIGPRN